MTITLYAGETTRIKTTGKDFDGVVLTDQNVTQATIVITLKSNGSSILPATGLTWDNTHKYWYYDWDTTTITAGTYRAKCTLVGNIFKTWEYIDVRLKVNPT